MDEGCSFCVERKLKHDNMFFVYNVNRSDILIVDIGKVFAVKPSGVGIARKTVTLFVWIGTPYRI